MLRLGSRRWAIRMFDTNFFGQVILAARSEHGPRWNRMKAGRRRVDRIRRTDDRAHMSVKIGAWKQRVWLSGKMEEMVEHIAAMTRLEFAIVHFSDRDRCGAIRIESLRDDHARTTGNADAQ